MFDNNEIITDQKEASENLNNFFIETVENLYIEYFLERDKYEGNPINTIEEIMENYERHPNVLKIKEYASPGNAFSFSSTITQEVETAGSKKSKC